MNIKGGYQVPEGYDHKATSESFNGGYRVSIYHSDLHCNYLVEIDDGLNTKELFIDKKGLELIAHAAADVFHDERI